MVLFAVIAGLTMGTSLMAGTYSGGTGVDADNAFLISNTDDLIELSNTSSDWDAYFKQTADIAFDANEENVDWDGDGTADWDTEDQLGFSPIGNSSTNFTGSYDGNEKTISNLFINRPSQDFIGLFGYVNGDESTTEIYDLGVTNVDITGNDRVGGLLGYNLSSTVSNSYSTGSVSGTGNYVGGLVGQNNSSTVSNSYSTGSVSGSAYVGGLVGQNQSSSTVSNSYSTGSVSGSTYVGGLVGNSISNSTVSNSYSTGSVTRSSGTNTGFGGFCGYNESSTIEHCYSIGDVFSSPGIAWNVGENKDKGFVGDKYKGTYTSNFFDSEASNQTTAIGATAKNTAEMKTQSTYQPGTDNWNFTTVWEIVGDNYPRLIENRDSSLPVELTSFTAVNHSGGVLLNWSTESEIENLGFIIQRKSAVGANHDLPSEWLDIASYITNDALEGHGSTTARHDYQYSDTKVQPGVTCTYRLGDVDFSGNVTWHQTVEITVEAESAKIPTEFGLQNAYPNPFNPAVTLRYGLTKDAQTILQVYNMRGQLVETLVNMHQLAGTYDINWQPVNLSAGVYIVRLQSGNQTNLQKVVFVK